MPDISQWRSSEHVFLLAAVLAAIAAVFMLTIWTPLQLQAFANATEVTRIESSAASNDAWSRVPFVTADGNMTSLAASNGRVRVVTMLYTHCPGMCPLAVSTLQRMQTRLSPIEQKQLSIIALSLDPERDSIARLQEFRNARGLDASRWVLGRTSSEGVRQMAGALGVRYRVLGDDSVDHQSVFVLLGRSGRVLARSYDALNVGPAFLGALQAALNAD